jgi:transposase
VAPFFEHRPLGALQALVDLLELSAILNLNPDVLHPGRCAALADGEVDPRVFQHPLPIVALPIELWTCPRVSWLIQRHFGVHYHPAHVSRLLHGLGFSPQRPTRRALERDEERIRAWIEQDWPRVKKTPRA